MPLSVTGVAALREALVADIVTAWGVQRVYTSAPEMETPTDAGNLPVAALMMDPSRFDSQGGGINAPKLRPLFRIIGRFAKPEGITLSTLKEQRAQELLDVLTADWHYHGATYNPTEIVYAESPDESDAARSYYAIMIEFPLHL